jgi:hypothetical protein
MLCEPALSEEVVKVACPEALSVPVPSVVAPSLKVTVPLGVPPPLAGVTVAVKVTACPTVLGFGDDDSVVTVARWAHAVVGASPSAHSTPTASANALPARPGFKPDATGIRRRASPCLTVPPVPTLSRNEKDFAMAP